MNTVDPITTEIIRNAFIAIANDMNATIIMPIFWRGELAGFAASRAHWLDVGAKDPGAPVESCEIYQRRSMRHAH